MAIYFSCSHSSILSNKSKMSIECSLLNSSQSSVRATDELCSLMNFKALFNIFWSEFSWAAINIRTAFDTVISAWLPIIATNSPIPYLLAASESLWPVWTGSLIRPYICIRGVPPWHPSPYRWCWPPSGSFSTWKMPEKGYSCGENRRMDREQRRSEGRQGGTSVPGAGLGGAHFWVRTSDVTLNFGPRRISKMGPQFP